MADNVIVVRGTDNIVVIDQGSAASVAQVTNAANAAQAAITIVENVKNDVLQSETNINETIENAVIESTATAVTQAGIATTKATEATGQAVIATQKAIEADNSNLAAASSANAANLAAQNIGSLAFTTVALMNTDLAHGANAICLVTNDPTITNNGQYIKLGASGAGSWQKSAYVPPLASNAVKNTDVYVSSNNLVNSIASYLDTILNKTTGATSTQSGWKTTDFIPISASTSYFFSTVRYICYYDSNKTFISSVDGSYTNYTTASPSNAAYMRVTYVATSTLSITLGSTATNITNYGMLNSNALLTLKDSIKSWFRSEAYTITSTISYNQYGRPTSPLNITWPDNATGVLTITYNNDGNVTIISATHISHLGTFTVTQAAITYVDGLPTVIPAVTIN
ncbi:hypothetical protein [Pelosinus sp. UFO1]|uniref:hypothetical protein n=1 Tax=Pelosinus sp. UFO1 TaxID=484770 RepID=UPI0004D148CD|nr:hypothetical protein [Pelosinus sp. UFO1]AIF51994.1 hypothetical protein UFO1_2447 [Pelosinus sp. UFO1]